jgi:hypothetical protein
MIRKRLDGALERLLSRLDPTASSARGRRHRGFVSSSSSGRSSSLKNCHRADTARDG